MSSADAIPRPEVGGVRQVYDVANAADLQYSPELDGAADPGEIIWAWVPYEENDAIGKDRPLIVIGRKGPELLALMMSSNPDRADDRGWLTVGTGAWDSDGRPSFVLLDRIYALDEHDLRREGAVLDADRFAEVAEALRRRRHSS